MKKENNAEDCIRPNSLFKKACLIACIGPSAGLEWIPPTARSIHQTRVVMVNNTTDNNCKSLINPPSAATTVKSSYHMLVSIPQTLSCSRRRVVPTPTIDDRAYATRWSWVRANRHARHRRWHRRVPRSEWRYPRLGP